MISDDPQARLDLYQRILDHLSDAVIARDADGAVRYANPAARQLHQLQLDDATAARAAEVEELWRNASHGTIGGKVAIQSIELPAADERGGAISIERNISQRRRAEAALRESQERLERVIANVPGVVYQFITHPDGSWGFTYVNQAVSGMYGIEPQQLFDQPTLLMDAVREDQRKAFDRGLSNAIREREEWNWNGPIVNRRGEERWVQTSARPSRQPDGSILWDGVVTDLTPIRRAERELERRQEQRARYQSALVEVAKSPEVNHGELREAVRLITETLCRATPVERASVWLYDASRTAIEALDLFECADERHTGGAVLRAADYPAYFKALEVERTLAANDAHAHPATAEFSAGYLTPLGIGALLDTPIRLGSQMVGVVCLEHVGPAREWSIDEEAFAASAADLVALVLSGHERRQAEAQHNQLQEELIALQTQMLAELSTPLIPLSDHALLMPLIGGIDTARAQRIMDALLHGVNELRATVALIDLTGVPIVDTQVASALIQAARAVRLLGARVVLTGLRPELAQTLVSLGVDLSDVETRASLQAAITDTLTARPAPPPGGARKL
ncbi:MAG TPA: PAS domain S-box protein [Herpetosiphonaceae bacterium]